MIGGVALASVGVVLASDAEDGLGTFDPATSVWAAMEAQGLSPCDAELLARAWGDDRMFGVDWTKASASTLDRARRAVARARRRAVRRQWWCAPEPSGFGPPDFVALGLWWEVPTPEAEARLAEGITRGDIDTMRIVAAEAAPLLAASAEDPYPEARPPLDPEALAVFFGSGLRPCDAAVVAQAWGLPLGDAQVALGQKVRDVGVRYARQRVAEVRRETGVRCR